MSKTGIIENFELIYKNRQDGGDPIVIAKITPTTMEEKRMFGDTPDMEMFLSTADGAYNYDKTIPKSFNLELTLEDNFDYSEPGIYFLKNKLVPSNLELTDATVNESSDSMAAINGSHVKENFKVIRSKDQDSHMAVSDKSIDLRTGESGINISQEGITINGNMTRLDFPTSDHVLMKETGILRLFPKGFPPPFSKPDHGPNLKFLAKIQKTGSRFTQMSKAFEALNALS